MPPKADRLLFIAIILALLLHGSALLYNIDFTYDAFVHIFFADHYARSWFDPWEYRWYTGFPVTSYPPLVHQLIALLSFIGGLKFGFIIVILSALCFFVIGIYRFAQLWVPQHSAAYAAIFAVLASSIVQTIHIYGQLPTMLGIACLINALPEVYAYFRTRKLRYLILGISLLWVTVASHHVTTIFGVVFFIAPVIATALLDESGVKGKFLEVVKRFILTLFDRWVQFFSFFSLLIAGIVTIIFPYWYWSKTDPISQVPIPHGSRDSFIEVPSSGLMFFLIPMGFTILMLPFIFKSLYNRRNIFLGLSFTMLLILGTGGTTPIPRIILGSNAFNILTLDRFTFWATVIAISFIGDFFCRLVEGDIRKRIINRYGRFLYHSLFLILTFVITGQALFILNFHKYRSLQPATIDVQPIVTFLNRDEHNRWRFMTLGFGDQMAWLSAQTTALSIDGNYHSARRVPEMTTRPLERLENSKFKGIPGLGSLQQFLTIPEKYHLKFIFSNDKFYDPLLYFTGWERVQRLENGIMVWQKHDIPPLSSIIPRKYIQPYQAKMWAVLPVSSFAILVFLIIIYRKRYLFHSFLPVTDTSYHPEKGNRWLFVWTILVLMIAAGVWLRSLLTNYRNDPVLLLQSYYHALDFKYYEEAHDYFIPGKITLDEYVLQLSVRDGLLASYSKLDSIAIKIQRKKMDTVNARVVSWWVTPLEKYIVQTDYELVKSDHGWLIDPPAFASPVVADEHIEKGVLRFHSQGRRVVTTGNTRHEDVLDRPSLRIISASLVRYSGQYLVIGELINDSYLPAHTTIEADVYDQYGRKMVNYNVKFCTIHNILPHEKVPFKITFEETAWLKEDDKQPLKFNPHEFSAAIFNESPVDFRLFARAVVANKDLYRDNGVQDVIMDTVHQCIKGSIINYGVEEISVPQLLFTYYGQHGEVVWVDHLFLKDGIRPQGKESFFASMPLLDSIHLIKEGNEKDFYVNGLLKHSYPSMEKGRLRTVGIQVNSFIGSPTIY